MKLRCTLLKVTIPQSIITTVNTNAVSYTHLDVYKRQRIYVEYLNNTHVYALKNSGKKKFYTQHGTWIKTQYYSLVTNIGNLPGAILRDVYKRQVLFHSMKPNV